MQQRGRQSRRQRSWQCNVPAPPQQPQLYTALSDIGQAVAQLEKVHDAATAVHCKRQSAEWCHKLGWSTACREKCNMGPGGVRPSDITSESGSLCQPADGHQAGPRSLHLQQHATTSRGERDTQHTAAAAAAAAPAGQREGPAGCARRAAGGAGSSQIAARLTRAAGSLAEPCSQGRASSASFCRSSVAISWRRRPTGSSRIAAMAAMTRAGHPVLSPITFDYAKRCAWSERRPKRPSHS